MSSNADIGATEDASASIAYEDDFMVSHRWSIEHDIYIPGVCCISRILDANARPSMEPQPNRKSGR